MNKLILSILFVLPLMAHAETYFGYRGDDGRSGESGRDGQDGYDQTIRADGNSQNIDVSGTNGSDGYDGRNGEEAYSCRHNYPADNTRGVRGGDGGLGGSGGRGGNGGDITIYFTDVSALKKIYVRAQAGRSGRAGYGGDSGYGCRCPSPTSWQKQYCYKDKNGKEICENRSYYCNAGESGRRGERGREDADGWDGAVTLIRSADELQPDMPTKDVDFSYLDRSSPFTLTKNIFKEETGARRLLAAGSIVRDEYWSFSERKTAKVDAKWMSRRSPQDFAGADMTFRLTNDTLTAWNEPRIWAETEIHAVDGGFAVNVNRIVYENETDKLNLEGILGNEKNLKLYVRDTAQISDQVNTTFWLKYESDGVINHTRYEGDVAATLVHLKDHVYEIDVGQLPIKDKYLKSGEDIKITVETVRKLGEGNSGQKLKSDYKIP